MLLTVGRSVPDMKNMSRFNLDNKIALITGAAGLLGKEHTFALLESGAKVVVTDHSKKNLSDFYQELKNSQYADRCLLIEMDVTNLDSINAANKNVVKSWGSVDILINNAAVDPKVTLDGSLLEESRFENFSLQQWNFQMSVGLTGAYLCSQVFGSCMENNGGGVILNIASDLSMFAPDQRIYMKDGINSDMQPVKPVTYSVIKTGLIGLTKYLSTYWADKNIRVNALSPGGVFVDQSEIFVKKLENLIPMARMANKNEYREAVQFLCSEASSYMTGQNLVIDGGRSVW